MAVELAEQTPINSSYCIVQYRVWGHIVLRNAVGKIPRIQNTGMAIAILQSQNVKNKKYKKYYCNIKYNINVKYKI